MADRIDASKTKVDSGVPLYDVIDKKEELNYSAVITASMNRESIYTDAAATTNAGSKNTEVQGRTSHTKILVAIIILISGVLIMLICGCFFVIFSDIAKLKLELSSVKTNGSLSSIQDTFEELINIQNNKVQLQLNTTTNESLARMERRLSEFWSDMENLLSRKIEQLINSSMIEINEQFTSQLEAVSTGLYAFYPAPSCAALPPSSPSGYYWVRASNDSAAVRVYCDDITRSCGGVAGGWRRVAELDMTNSSHQCPSGLRQRTDSNKRTCVSNSDPAGCSSVTISTATLEYSRVCGKIIAYQFGAPAAFANTRPQTLDSHYLDGVSVTHGSPRHHIWSLTGGLDEVNSCPHCNCPCINVNFSSEASQPPAFVGNDYFCDTGSSGHYEYIFYGDNPLWDGAGCGSVNTCCSFNNPPWFSKQLPQLTTDDMEMRVCRNEVASIADIAIEAVAIYVQ